VLFLFHLRVAATKFAHVVVNYAKLGFKKASKATTSIVVFGEVRRDPF
jgi:hypothetical protein